MKSLFVSPPRKFIVFVFCLIAGWPAWAGPLSRYEGAGTDEMTYRVEATADGIVVTAFGRDVTRQSFFIALGGADRAGSVIVPFKKGAEGSTIFLPFQANVILSATPAGDFVRHWKGTKWSERAAADGAFRVKRERTEITVTIPAALAGSLETLKLAAYFKDFAGTAGWGRVWGNIDPSGVTGDGDLALRGYLAAGEGKWELRTRGGTDLSKVRIYQFLPRLFGNTNETRKSNGTMEENGSGKLSDLNDAALAALKDMGFTHVWPTGVLQQATATDYSSIGEPADDPDLLKGLAGSPYAIKDYFDICPDYANDPAKRLEEFREMVDRVHRTGMKVIIDFVPNHVARSYASTIRPDLSFGAKDDAGKFFSAQNNFYWLTPESNAPGGGPPLRLPTVDAAGNPTSPTAKVAKAPSDGLFGPETKTGRVTGNNIVSWRPDAGSWYETVKLNYGFDFTDASKGTREYPNGDRADVAIPDTWGKMDEVIAYWQGMGVDGFRVDMAHMVPPEFWQWMISRARVRDAEVFFVAEAYNDDPAKVPAGDPLVAEVGGGNVMFDLLNAGFDAVYDDATYDRVKDIYEKGAWANDLDSVKSRPLIFDNSLRYGENHDEVRLAGKGHWGDIGREVGRPVTALLFGLSRGPVMIYSGQEVGEPADGVEGFGGDDARTSIFDYWSMPELTKWVNEGKFDGGKLSGEQSALREFYGRLLKVVNEPAFRNGNFLPLNPANVDNAAYGRAPGDLASGHWLYSFLRRDPVTGQRFLVVINLHRSQTFDDVRVVVPLTAQAFLGLGGVTAVVLKDRLGSGGEIESPVPEWSSRGVSLGSIPPLSASFFEITERK